MICLFCYRRSSDETLFFSFYTHTWFLTFTVCTYVVQHFEANLLMAFFYIPPLVIQIFAKADGSFRTETPPPPPHLYSLYSRHSGSSLPSSFRSDMRLSDLLLCIMRCFHRDFFPPPSTIGRPPSKLKGEGEGEEGVFPATSLSHFVFVACMAQFGTWGKKCGNRALFLLFPPSPPPSRSILPTGSGLASREPVMKHCFLIPSPRKKK